MGYMVHHMIVVTSYHLELVQRAHARAREIFCVPRMAAGKHMQVTDILTSPVNHYYTFFVPPDGSKEGWSDSEDGDARRALFITWLNAQRFEDGSTSLKWAEVQYGDDSRDNRMLRHDGEVEPCDPDPI